MRAPCNELFPIVVIFDSNDFGNNPMVIASSIERACPNAPAIYTVSISSACIPNSVSNDSNAARTADFASCISLISFCVKTISSKMGNPLSKYSSSRSPVSSSMSFRINSAMIEIAPVPQIPIAFLLCIVCIDSIFFSVIFTRVIAPYILAQPF